MMKSFSFIKFFRNKFFYGIKKDGAILW
jgi:hypothetical protein